MVETHATGEQARRATGGQGHLFMVMQRRGVHVPHAATTTHVDQCEPTLCHLNIDYKHENDGNIGKFNSKSIVN